MMARDLLRVLGLWRSRAGWLALARQRPWRSALPGLRCCCWPGRAWRHRAAAATGRGATGWAAASWRSCFSVRSCCSVPAARWLERMVSHAATFRALADLRVWFFRRLAERMPAGLGGRSSGDLLGRLVADVEALDSLYLRAILPAMAALAAVLAAAWRSAASRRRGAGLSAALLALPLPFALAPAAARGAGEAARRRVACARRRWTP